MWFLLLVSGFISLKVIISIFIYFLKIGIFSSLCLNNTVHCVHIPGSLGKMPHKTTAVAPDEGV